MGYCLDVVDLFMSKALAGRDKDRGFCIALLEYKYVKLDQVLDLVSTMPINDTQQRRLRSTIRRWAKSLDDNSDESSNT